MSIKDLIRKKKIETTRKFINTEDITDYGLKTYVGGDLVYIVIKPVNLLVLTSAKIQQKIQQLVVVLSELEEIEIICLSSRENFDDNKEFLKSRFEEERNPKLREILEKDMKFFDMVQIQTSSAREFMIILRFNTNKEKEIYNTTNRALKLLTEQGFYVRRGNKDDIKKMLAVYFVQNVTQVYFEDFNGIRYVKQSNEYL